MNLKALLAAALGGILLARNTEPRLPAGWSRLASVEADRACVAGVDHDLTERGRRLLTLECSRNVDGYIAVTQTISADEYLGKRVRFAARVRTDKVQGWTGLTMRVVTADQRVLGFDDMSTRPLRGSQGWRDAAVVLDVDRSAASITFGLRLNDGAGQVWIDGLRFEEVPADDPTLSIQLKPVLPQRPQNLELQ
jgi:hypothetical protein